MAGKRLGKEDDRHLWPEMLRVIREVRPRWVVGENVLGLVNWNGGLVFHEVQTDLEAQGYEVQPFVLPAAAVGAPHRRDRVWFVAYANFIRHTSRGESESFKRNRSGNNGVSQEWSEQTERIDGLFRFQRNATNTDLHGCNERDGEHEEQPSETGVDAFRDIEQSVGNGIATDTDSYGVQRRAVDAGTSEGFRQGGACIKEARNDWSARRWEGFPTQPPVCSGNDGIPDKLDGITFSKWRNESIKAYGNAVVPQVVLQIFRTIEEYEKTHAQ
jgi:DNA (cytosine-5)-methyltransferase 1